MIADDEPRSVFREGMRAAMQAAETKAQQKWATTNPSIDGIVVPRSPEAISRIVIPHVPGMLFRETQQWGESCGAEFRDVGGDQEAYFHLLAELWRGGRSFVVVEHDIAPPPNALTDFASCAEPFCGHSYPYTDSGFTVEGHLGCTRFSGELLRAIPDVVEKSVEEHNRFWVGGGPKSWLMLSQRIKKRLKRYGIDWHLHRPAALHLKLGEKKT